MKKFLMFTFVFLSLQTRASQSCIITAAQGMELKVFCSDPKIKLDSFVCQNDVNMDNCSQYLIVHMKNLGYELNTIQSRVYNGWSREGGKYFFSK